MIGREALVSMNSSALLEVVMAFFSASIVLLLLRAGSEGAGRGNDLSADSARHTTKEL